MNENNAAQPVLTDGELKASSPFQWLARRYTPEVAERMLREHERIVLSKLRAPVADEWVLPPLPAAWGSAINDAGDGHVDLYSAEQMQEYTRAALASTPVAKPAPEHFKPPFDNCSFRMCDLPGQCRGEGKCHHPASAPVADERAAHGYGSPADVSQRIEQYLAQDGRMNSGTQLLYEAMKALRSLAKESK